MDTPNRRPAIVLIAIIAVVCLALISLLSAVLNNPVIAIPQAIIALIAAIGLKRGHAWAGYGIAIFLCCATAGGVFAASKIGSVQNPYLLVGAIVPLAVAAFAFLAGKELASQNAGTKWAPIPWLILAAIPVALSLFFNLFFMPTGSMEPTVLPGDSLIVRRAAPSSVKRGDLVVYHEPSKQSIFVKRIVGVAGDRIHLDRKSLYLNGRPVNEAYALHNTDYIDRYRDNFPLGDINIPLSVTMQEQLRQQVRDGDFVVPPGTFFVLGDNRDVSLDSRYTGVIPAAAVIGKPWLVCFSAELPKDSMVRSEPHNVLARARWNRVLKPL